MVCQLSQISKVKPTLYKEPKIFLRDVSEAAGARMAGAAERQAAKIQG